MSDLGWGLLGAAATVVLTWFAYQAIKSGEATFEYFVDSSRTNNPILFWFDVVTTAILAIIAAAVTITLCLQNI
ncbi:hypothetical protein [Croceicoccus sp. Ery15]|uniref:hypothetical protein n=1 Tax=Croceicoccus sp. Ery15 TaxID=1703338 RepID=UPI001E35B16B|nr:hypothetical protein [Croceicoccus sp. Ery15]